MGKGSNSTRVSRAEYWRERIAEHERSGLSVQGFCHEHGLREQSFYAWRRRMNKPATVRFAVVETGPSKRSDSNADLELVLATGERLRIRSSVDAAALRTVLEVLRG